MNILMIADAFTAVSYLVIACFLYYYWQEKKAYIPHHITLFAVAATLFVKALIFGNQTFNVLSHEQLIFLAPLSALFSCYAALTISKFGSYFLSLKLPNEYQLEINDLRNQLTEEIEENKIILQNLIGDNKELLARIQDMQEQMQLQKWIEEKEIDLDNMKSTISRLRQ